MLGTLLFNLHDIYGSISTERTSTNSIHSFKIPSCFQTFWAKMTPTSTFQATERAFAGLCADGSVVSWGDPHFGGAAPPTLRDVRRISATSGAFAALQGGRVVTWGDQEQWPVCLSPAVVSNMQICWDFSFDIVMKF